MPSPEQSLNPVVLPTRRSFLSTSAIAIGGVVASTSVSSAALFRHSTPIDLSFLPKVWAQREGERTLQSYARYLKGLRLKFITPEQVIKAHARRKGSTWNSLPPKSMWRAMGGTLKAADRVAATLGMPVKEVTSAYRSPAYNRRCPGAKRNSWHMRNYALDLQFGTSTYKVAQAARYVRDKGYFKGGVGRYSSFTHIDTRGHNVNW